MATLDEVNKWIRSEVALVLDRPVEELAVGKTFAQLGVDSGMVTHLLIALEDKLQIELDPDVVASLPTIEELSVYALGLTAGKPGP